jgi:aminoglycoside/choline kinase family phosphotransferase
MDNRLSQLKSWVGSVLDVTDYEVRPASSDASFRRYFRVIVPGATHIVMDAPPERQDLRPFLAVAQRLQGFGLHVPEVVEQDLVHGFLLLSDLGDRTYLRELNEVNADALYDDALVALRILQKGGLGESHFLPPYDEAVLRRELEIFREWYLGHHLGVTLKASQAKALAQAWTVLVRAALEQPRVWVHRDYHSRNLMVVANNNPGILDFQDALYGPITYDLVSLLRDCYIAWPHERIDDWLEGQFVDSRAMGLPVGRSLARYRRWFDLMGAQRHLKAAGIFARLNHRDGKPGYLADIPRTLGYVWAVSVRYPELSGLRRFLDELEIPGVTA